MDLPVDLPIAPMLAKGVTTVPVSGDREYCYEPKWDGFRCIVAKDEDEVELFGRSRKPLTRYFPEVVDFARRELPRKVVLDGELVVPVAHEAGSVLNWESLSARIHPATSRVKHLATETPAELVAFDILALGRASLMDSPLRDRRRALNDLMADIPRQVGIHVGVMTTDAEEARRWFTAFEGAGIDGIVAKDLASPCTPNARTMLKVKHKRTAEAVVLGYRVHKSGEGVGSLLLGLVDPETSTDSAPTFRNVGGIVSFTAARRRELVAELDPLVLRDEEGHVVAAETERSRFSSAKDRTFVPLRPERVVEVAFDQLEGDRFRHAVTFLRWRDDRDPASCTLDQIDRAQAADFDALFDRP